MLERFDRGRAGSFAVRALQSYALDWILNIALAAVFFSLNKVDGFKREFSIDDPTLRFPYATHERVPTFALYMISFVAPLVLQFLINLLTLRSVWDAHNSALGLFFSLSLAGSITQFVKITVGRPRPDVISRCMPHSGIANPEYGLVSAAICTQTNLSIMQDGWRSFPSGHSSLSFAGLGFLAFYLAGKLHLFDERGHTPKAWLALTPLSGAALVAISRTMDYRHHWQDVLIGSALGLTTAYFSYRQYYPSLTSASAEQPFPPRLLKKEGAILPTHIVGGETNGGSPSRRRLTTQFQEDGTQGGYRDSIDSGGIGEGSRGVGGMEMDNTPSKRVSDASES